MGIRLDRRRVLCQYKGPFFQNSQIQSFQNVRYKYRFRIYQFRTLQQGWPCIYGKQVWRIEQFRYQNKRGDMGLLSPSPVISEYHKYTVG